MNKKVFFVTGGSRGIGLGITQVLLEEGHFVAGTSRSDTESLNAIVKSTCTTSYSEAHYLPLQVDLTSDDSVKKALEKTIEKFSRVDVIINNAGYAVSGAIEELSDQELKDQFDVNVFACARVLRLAAPILRHQKSGHVINVSSLVGFWGEVAGIGAYIATKYALTGMTAAFSMEMKPFGVKVTSIQPGYFRTEIHSEVSMRESKNKIDAYSFVHENYVRHRDIVHGTEKGDPVKLGRVVLKIVEKEGPAPTNVFIGADAYYMAKKQISHYQQCLDEWEDIGAHTDVDE